MRYFVSFHLVEKNPFSSYRRRLSSRLLFLFLFFLLLLLPSIWSFPHSSKQSAETFSYEDSVPAIMNASRIKRKKGSFLCVGKSNNFPLTGFPFKSLESWRIRVGHFDREKNYTWLRECSRPYLPLDFLKETTVKCIKKEGGDRRDRRALGRNG